MFKTTTIYQKAYCFFFLLILLCNIPSANAATIYVAPGGTVPLVIPSGDIYICEGTHTFYGSDIDIQKKAKLIVRNGATLKMTGKITVLSGSFSSLIDMAVIIGGILEVHQATITRNSTVSTSRWKGIEIRGSNTPLFTTTSYLDLYEVRGKAFIHNATISYANCAVKTAQRVSTTSHAFKGGIIQSTNTTYLNNDTMVLNIGRPYTFMLPSGPPYALTPVPLNGYEFFINCTFKLDNGYVSSSPLHPHFVRLVDATGLKILSCKFVNNKYYGTTFAARNTTGIYALNSSFLVSNAYNTMATGSWGGTTTTVARSQFQNFYDGILVFNEGGLQPISINNTDFSNVAHGITLVGTVASQVFNDTLSLTQIGTNPESLNTPAGDRTNGIELISSRNFKVYKNVINGINGHNFSQGIGVNNAGTLYHNIFYNIVFNTKYGLRGLTGNHSSNLYEGLKLNCNILWENNNKSTSYDISSKYAGISKRQGYFDGVFKYDPMNAFGIKYTGGYNVYNEPGEGTIVYYSLDETIVASDNVDVEDADYGDNCVRFILPISTPKPAAGIPSRIGAAATSIRTLTATSPRTTSQEQALATATHLYYSMIDSVLNHYLYSDSVSIKWNDIKEALIPAKGNLYHQLLLADVYIAAHAYDPALATIAQIPIDFVLSQDEQTMIDQLATIIEVQQRYAAVDGNWDSVSVADKNTILSIKDNGVDRPRYIAQSIWYKHNDFVRANNHFDWGIIQAPPQNKPSVSTLANTGILLYPNPTSDVAQIDLGADYSSAKHYSYRIVDMKGTELLKGILPTQKSTIQTATLSNGIYYIEIMSNFTVLDYSKLSIVR